MLPKPWPSFPIALAEIDPNENVNHRKFLSSASQMGKNNPSDCCRPTQFTVEVEALYAWLAKPWNLSKERTTLYEIYLPVEMFSRLDLDPQGNVVGLASRVRCCLDHYQSRTEVNKIFPSLDKIEHTIDALAPLSAMYREN